MYDVNPSKLTFKKSNSCKLQIAFSPFLLTVLLKTFQDLDQ